jgi:hypothetical protein
MEKGRIIKIYLTGVLAGNAGVVERSRVTA